MARPNGLEIEPWEGVCEIGGSGPRRRATQSARRPVRYAVCVKLRDVEPKGMQHSVHEVPWIMSGIAKKNYLLISRLGFIVRLSHIRSQMVIQCWH